MRTILYIVITVLFVSCSKDNKSKIVGEWYKVDNWINTGKINANLKTFDEPTKLPNYYPFGFEFFEGDSIEYFLGVWEKSDEFYTYNGQYRLYHVATDSLFIYDLNNELHTKYKMELLGNDTLLLYESDKPKMYVRFTSRISEYVDIDSIQVVETHGWGLNIEYSVSSTGKIKYHNSSYLENQVDILETGIITTNEFKNIELKYNKSNFQDISDYGGCCDGFAYTTTIYFRNSKKQIFDYENQSPMQLIWANRYLMSMVKDQLNIKK